MAQSTDTLGVPRKSRKGELMVRRTLLIANLGPTFAGWVGLVDGKMVCVAPPELARDTTGRRKMREIVKRGGGDCLECRSCQVGQGT